MRRLLMTTVVLLMLCNVGAAVIKAHDRGAPAQTAAPNPAHEKWLSEDVAYIITPEEKLAFLRLKADEEREHFIEMFWRRRDATLDTRENEYRAAYYERIAYANRTFAAAGVAGWRTDRGRIFITHGKPDLVRKTASGEVWTYKLLPGAGDDLHFEFVGGAGAGDLRLRR